MICCCPTTAITPATTTKRSFYFLAPQSCLQQHPQQRIEKIANRKLCEEQNIINASVGLEFNFSLTLTLVQTLQK